MDKQFPVDETDSSSLGGDSPKHVEAMNLAETPKSLVSLCKSAISLPKLGVSNLRTSMTPSKMGPVPDFNHQRTIGPENAHLKPDLGALSHHKMTLTLNTHTPLLKPCDF